MSRVVQIPSGPVLRAADVCRLPLAAGRWLAQAHLRPTSFADYTELAQLDIISGIYLITDAHKQVRWLGQANRQDGLVARLAEHARDPGKVSVFATVRLLQLVDHTPPGVVSVIEGRCADVLGLRGAMGPRKWPPSDDWLALVA